MSLFLKLVCSSWRIRHFVFFKFLVVRGSGNNFLNEGLEFGCLSGTAIVELKDLY